MATLIETNEYQTPITEELLSQYPEEVVQQFTEIVNIVPFIKNLINPNRPKIEDLPRDKEGRAIVDITNPPIYKDADYFRQAALFYLKNDCYTKLRPNSNPNSEYRKYWREELRRCREGLIRQSDGMYVTGFLYWFLNYCPMMVNFYKEGQKKAIRKESFGFFFEGIWWRSIYLYNAREQGHHAIELAKRGCAKSYFLATIMSHNLIVGESEAAHKRCITVLTAAQKEYLKDDKDGTLNKFIPELSFVIDNTPFPNLLLKNSPNEMSWQMGYKKPNGAIGGSMNQVLGVSAKDDSDKLRGKRGWILYEEMGTFDGLLELYDVTRKSVEDGDYTFSCMYLVGTANNKESSFLSAKKLLYAPESYNIQSVPNVYDKKGSGKDVFGFFFPAYINRAGCYNKDGISDVIKALLQVLMARYKAKYGADPTSVLRVIAEDPITPAEAIIKVKDAYFPVASLQERADTLDKNPSLYDDVYVGELYTTSTGEIAFRSTDDIPIRTYPVDNDTKGALEIYSMPKKDREGKVFNDRYIIGVDPYDNDQAESHSLYSIFVLDTFVDDLSAEYTGRTNFADEAHDMVLKLCIFYNAKALYESNKKGLYSYMEKTRNTFRLADTPEYLRDKQLVKYSSFGSNAKGVNVSANINNFANRLIKDWLLMKVPVEVKQEDGHIEIQEVPKLYTLKTRALIEEAIQFNPDINVDRIRALGILMLYREQYIIRYGTGRTESSSEILSKDYAGNDEFFTKNFDARHIGKQ